MITDIVALAVVERAFAGHSHLWRITDRPVPVEFYTAVGPASQANYPQG